MENTKHTPTPWRIEEKISGNFILGTNSKVQVGRIINPEDAKMILRAVNSHEALLHAVKNVVWKLSHDHSASGKRDDCKPGTIDRNDAVVELCRIAIAKAEGK